MVSIFNEVKGYVLTDEWAEIDIISTSVVHQSVQHIDFSLKIQKPKDQ